MIWCKWKDNNDDDDDDDDDGDFRTRNKKGPLCEGMDIKEHNYFVTKHESHIRAVNSRKSNYKTKREGCRNG